MPKLVFLGEKFGGRVYELVPEKTTVGRGNHNKLAIRHDSVSNAHCEILVNGPEVIIHDLGSANGTFLNGARVTGQCQIKDGQVVRFGSVEARLELGPQRWEDTATEETAVHAMQRIMRDQRRKQNTPKPADPSMTLESEPAADLGDHTVLLSRPVQPPEAMPAPSPAPTEGRPRQTPKTVAIVIVVAAALGLAVLLCWLVWWRK